MAAGWWVTEYRDQALARGVSFAADDAAAVVAAAADEKMALEGEGQHGVFTYALLPTSRRVHSARCLRGAGAAGPLMNSQTLVVTANTSTLYAYSGTDLAKDGPTVIELPPGMLGVLNDSWPVHGRTGRGGGGKADRENSHHRHRLLAGCTPGHEVTSRVQQ